MLKLSINEKRAFITGAKRSGKIRDPEWLERLAAKGLVYGLDPSGAKAFRRQMATVAEVLEANYGEDWDFTLEHTKMWGERAGFAIAAVLHYPELEIRNAAEQSHTIRDLYAVLPFEKNQFKTKGDKSTDLAVNRLLVTRGSLTVAEADTGYRHSHVRRYSNNLPYSDMELLGFCIDGDSETRLQIVETGKKFTPEAFELLVMTVDATLRWESLDGVPYIRLSEIIAVSNRDYAECRNNWGTYLDNAVLHISTRGFDFSIAAGKFGHRYAIKGTDSFERELHRAIVATGDPYTISGTLAIKRNGAWKAYSENLWNFGRDIGDAAHYVHRDREVRFRLLNTKEENTNVNNYRVHPKFLSYAKDRIEQEMHVYVAKSLAAQRQAAAERGA